MLRNPLARVSVINNDAKQGIIMSASQKNGSKRDNCLSFLCNSPYFNMNFIESAGPKRWVVEGACVDDGESRDRFASDIS